MRNQDWIDAVFDLFLSEEQRISAIYFMMDEENIRLQLQQPWISVGTDAAGLDPAWAKPMGPYHPRAYGTFPRILGKFVRDEGVIPLEDAVRKMSSAVANRLGIRRRGLLREGFFADVVIFDPQTIGDRATFTDPHQLSVGVRDVWINGERVLANGEHTGATADQDSSDWRRSETALHMKSLRRSESIARRSISPEPVYTMPLPCSFGASPVSQTAISITRQENQMPTLIETLAGSLDAKTIQQLSAQLGVDNSTAQQAIGFAVPMLIGALSKNASNPAGAESLNNALHAHNGNVLQNVAATLTDEATLQDGAAILGHVLGGQESTVANGLGQMTGMDAGSSDQLLAMMAPLVMGALGQVQDDDGLDASGISSLLQSQSQEAVAASGLSQFLDMDGDGDATDDVISMGSQLLNSFFGRKR